MNINVVENDPGGEVVGRVGATDGDAGIYGEIRYILNDPTGRFTIDIITVCIIVQIKL